MENVQANEYAYAHAKVAEAKRLLTEAYAHANGDLSEAYVGFQLDSATFAQILMEHLPQPGMGFNVEQKQFWLQVFDHIGPDWLAEYRKVGGFMAKLAEF